MHSAAQAKQTTFHGFISLFFSLTAWVMIDSRMTRHSMGYMEDTLLYFMIHSLGLYIITDFSQ
jgi:hypothetical protein